MEIINNSPQKPLGTFCNWIQFGFYNEGHKDYSLYTNIKEGGVNLMKLTDENNPKNQGRNERFESKKY